MTSTVTAAVAAAAAAVATAARCAAILPVQLLFSQQIAGAAAEILGHNSAHSLATGPVMADPFISPLLLQITPALSSK